MAKAKKEVVAAPSGVVLDERPDWVTETERGSEAISIDDLVIPRIELIQDLSPQRKANKDEYIEGAETGMAFNTVTKELFDATIGLSVIPVFFRKEYVIWRDREMAGGGFHGAFNTELEAVRKLKSGEIESPEQCAVVETDQQFALILNGAGKWEEAVFSMNISKLKASRQWNSFIKIRGGDRFSSVYQLKSIEVEGGKGEYQNWTVKALGYAPEAAFLQAEAVYEAIVSGHKDVSRDTDNNSGEDVADTVG